MRVPRPPELWWSELEVGGSCYAVVESRGGPAALPDTRWVATPRSLGVEEAVVGQEPERGRGHPHTNTPHTSNPSHQHPSHQHPLTPAPPHTSTPSHQHPLTPAHYVDSHPHMNAVACTSSFT